MQQLPAASDAEVSPSQELASSADLPVRGWWGLLGLVVLTVGSLALAWVWPNLTMLHFLWVAQAVPILYFLLAWWGTQVPASNDHAS
jgi:hypothetical protein